MADMPSWLKRHFKSLKLEVSEHLWLAKNKNRLAGRQTKNGNGGAGGDDASDQSPVIRNDLRSNRRHNKNDKNAYRDYSKRCDEVLFYQNNCALRCAQEAAAAATTTTAKPLNTERNDNNNVKKTDDGAAAQKTCVKSGAKNVCDNAASTECCDRNCECQRRFCAQIAKRRYFCTFFFFFCFTLTLIMLLVFAIKMEKAPIQNDSE